MDCLLRNLQCLKTIFVGGVSLFTILGAFNVGAQESGDETDEDLLQEVVVTGSRMRGVDAPVGSTVISVDRDYIDQSGSVSVDQLIKEIPQAYNLGISESSRGQPGGNSNIVYGNSVNLRGIGPFSTLVLLDGHRVVTNSRNVDPSIVPTLAIERIEVVADGASAVYGSDAIAGVANLVQRRNVDGGQVVARYGSGDEYDEHLIGVSWGTTWDNGQFFAAVENGSRSDLNGFDRSFFRAQQPGADYRTPQCDPGNIVVDGVSYAIPEGGVDSGNVGSLQPGTQNLCESLVDQDLLPEQDYNTAAFTFNYQFTDSTEMFLDGYYGKREFERSGGFSAGSLTVPNTNAFFVDPSGTAPDSVTVQYSFEDDLPQGGSSGSAESWGLTTGLKQALPGDWAFDALVSYGENNEVGDSLNLLDSRGSLPAALASSDPATAFDPFGLHRTSAAVLADISDQIFNVDNTVEFTGIEASFNGPLFELPGGMVQMAVGYERQDINSLPTTARGAVGTPYRCDPCRVAGVSELKRTVDSYYAEFLVPIIGESSSSRQSLDFRVAYRYDDYSDVGTTENPQFGVTWAPNDSLSLRASYGESFRAPLFSELYGNSSGMFVEPFVDPTIGGAPTQGVFQSGGNPALDPESAKTWSLGIDYELPFTADTSLSLTYFEIEYENQIAVYLGDRNILLREEEFEGTNIIRRDQAAADRIDELLALGLPVRGVLPDPPTLYVDGRPNNLGRSETKGIDFLVRTAWTTSGDSEWVADFNGVWTLDHKVSITPSGTLLDKDNEIFFPLALRARASLSWYHGRYSARAVLNYIGGYDNVLASPSQDVDAYSPIDLNFWYELGDADGSGFGDGWVLGVEARNVFDEDPPYVNIAPSGNGSGGYDATASNPVGQVFAVSVRKTF
jgi:iron complex outermembrane receptor protein